MAGRVAIEREADLTWLVVEHPARRNAVTLAMWEAIPHLVAELAAEPPPRVVVLRGAGDEAFVSGADISEFERTRTGAEASRAYEATSVRAFEAIARLPMPVLAMIHGPCVGGGLALALSADLRFAADDAVFALPAARLGLGYHRSGLEALARAVGIPRAKEIFFTARRFDAAQALARGLVTEVVSKASLEARVREVAAEIAANAPLTLRSAKLGFATWGAETDRTARDDFERSVTRCFESEDYREGVRAFLDKRRPAFRGR